MADLAVVESKISEIEVELMKIIAQLETQVEKEVRNLIKDERKVEQILRMILRSSKTTNIYENLEYARSLQRILYRSTELIKVARELEG